jgi:O-6-methylguanine DNA methyltransferase
LTVSRFEKLNDVWFGVVLDDDQRVVSCGFSVEGKEDVSKQVLRAVPKSLKASESNNNGFASSVLRSLSLIYQGKDPEVVPRLAFENLPPFVRKALMVTVEIPRGCVSTYGAVAAAAGSPRAARAVGSAEARNPFAPVVPCHRVVSSTLGLGGYGGGLTVKKAFLAREGVFFEGKKVSARCLWVPRKDSS